ncbi:MAG: zinc-dependent metalloprotease [Flavobacteriaceae bacterium]
MKQVTTYLFTLLFSLGLQAQKKSKKNDLKAIDSLTKDMIAQKGLITTHLNEENTLYFELNENLLEKDILVVTRFAQLPANYSAYLNAGSKTAQQVLRFVKKGKKILIKQISYNNVTSVKEDPIAISVEENNFAPILAAFEIKNKETDRFLIDVSSHFMADSPGFNIIRKGDKDRYKIGGVDKKRSSIDSANSFPKNTEIRHTLTFSANKAPRANQAKTFSFQINHSFIALPEDPMPIRYEDERVGWFSLSKIDYSSQALKSDQYRIVRRWRLEPKDKEAYFKGELVEPIQPIVYYLDPATPLKWRKYFKQGIEDWNTAFEKAGFKNAILAKDPPSKEEDPDFSPEDVRYSTVRYVASTTRNATGPSVSDPRTGEILESDIIWYHNHLRSYRNRYLLETGAANPKARSLNTPEEEIGEMMRRVISHEIGHALGLPHNMKASSAYPVDSLRSGKFTQKFGIATTIMDYARYNYIAQPGDENIRFVRQLGPYDDYAIEWGYRYFGQDPKTEQKLLKSMVDEKSLDPMYMFGGRGNDPNSQTENIGDDPIKASNYGLSNLKIVAKNLMDWTLSPNDNYYDLEELYGELIGVYRRYIYHVHSMIGGVYQTRHNTNQTKAVTYQNVERNKQLAALRFLEQHLWQTQNWLMDTGLLSEIKGEGGLIPLQNLQRSALNRLLSVRRLNRMISASETLVGQGLNPTELLNQVNKSLMESKLPLDLSRKSLQIHFVTQLNSLLIEEKLNPSIKSEIKGILTQIHKKAKKQRKIETQSDKNHFGYIAEISQSE